MLRIITLGLALVTLSVPVEPAVIQSSPSSTDFHWSGVVAAGKTIQIKGVNGDVRAELSTGNEVEVTAVKRSRRDPVSSVSIETVQENGNVTICAVYPSEPQSRRRDRGGRADRGRRINECRVGNEGHIGSHDNDVAVEFLVRVPVGVALDAHTVNGDVDARGLKSNAYVRTVNGRIGLATTGEGTAETVNGSIDASVGASTWAGRLGFSTVNGSIALRLPKETHTHLRAKMTNGRFTSDFPVTVQGFEGRNRRVDGTIGQGGRDLDLETVNGSISLRFITP